jgi:hypothetical protein
MENVAARTKHRLDDPRSGSTVVAFQPILAASHRSHFRDAGAAGLLHSPDVDAEIVSFSPRGHARAVKPPPGRGAKPPAAHLPRSTEDDEEYRHRMMINLLASGWVTAVMTGGYFALSGLVPAP